MSNWKTFDKNKTQTTSQTANSPITNSPENSGFFKIPESVLQVIPWIPFALESVTGQKIPPMGGTMGEIQLTISQILLNQQQILTNQGELRERLINLETNAVNQFGNLDRRIENIQSVRLTHERKQVEYNTNKNLENYEN